MLEVSRPGMDVDAERDPRVRLRPRVVADRDLLAVLILRGTRRGAGETDPCEDGRCDHRRSEEREAGADAGARGGGVNAVSHFQSRYRLRRQIVAPSCEGPGIEPPRLGSARERARPDEAAARSSHSDAFGRSSSSARRRVARASARRPSASCASPSTWRGSNDHGCHRSARRASRAAWAGSSRSSAARLWANALLPTCATIARTPADARAQAPSHRRPT